MESAAPPIIQMVGNIVLQPCLPHDVVLQPCASLVIEPVVPPVAPLVSPARAAEPTPAFIVPPVTEPVAPKPSEVAPLTLPVAVPAVTEPVAPASVVPELPPVPPVVESVPPVSKVAFIELVPSRAEPSCLEQEVDLTVSPKATKRSPLFTEWMIEMGPPTPPVLTADYLLSTTEPVNLEDRLAFVRYLFGDDFNNAFDEVYSLMPPRLTKKDRQRVSVEAAVNTWVMMARANKDSFFNVTIHLPHLTDSGRAAASALFPIDEQIAAFNEEVKAAGLKAPISLRGGASNQISGQQSLQAEQTPFPQVLQAAQAAFDVWLQEPVDAEIVKAVVQLKLPLSTQTTNKDVPLSFQIRHLLFEFVSYVLNHASVVHPVTLRTRQLKSLQFKELTDLQLLLYVTARTLKPLSANLEEQVFEEMEKIINFETLESSQEVLDKVLKDQQRGWLVRLLFAYAQLVPEIRSIHNKFITTPTYVKSWQAFNKYFDDYNAKKQADSNTHEQMRDAFHEFGKTLIPYVVLETPDSYDFTSVQRAWRKISLAGHPDKYKGPDRQSYKQKYTEASRLFTLMKENEHAPVSLVLEKINREIPVDVSIEWLPKFGVTVRANPWEQLVPNYDWRVFENTMGLRFNATTNKFDIVRAVQPQFLKYGHALANRMQSLNLTETQQHLLSQWRGNLTLLQQQRYATTAALKSLSAGIQLYGDNKSRWPQFQTAAEEFLQEVKEHHSDDVELQSVLNQVFHVTAQPMSPNLPFWWTREWLFKDGKTVRAEASSLKSPFACPGWKGTRWRWIDNARVLRRSAFDFFNMTVTAQNGTEGGTTFTTDAASTNGKYYTPEFIDELVKTGAFNNSQEAYATLNVTLIPEASAATAALRNATITAFRETFRVNYLGGVYDLRGVLSPFDFQYLPPQLTLEPDLPLVETEPAAAATGTKPSVESTAALQEAMQSTLKFEVHVPNDFTQQAMLDAVDATTLSRAATIVVNHPSTIPVLNNAFEAAALNTCAASQAALNNVTFVRADAAVPIYEYNATAQHAFNIAEKYASVSEATFVEPVASVVADAGTLLANVTTVLLNTTVEALANAEQLNMQFLSGNASEILHTGQVVERLLVTVISNIDIASKIGSLAPAAEKTASVQVMATAQQVLAPILADQVIALSGVAANKPDLQPAVDATLQKITNLSAKLDILVPRVTPSVKPSYTAIVTSVNSAHVNDTAAKQLVQQVLNASRGALPHEMLHGTVRVMKNTRTINQLKLLVSRSATAAKHVKNISFKLLTVTLPEFVDAVSADATSAEAQQAAFNVIRRATPLNASLVNCIGMLQQLNRTVAAAVSADPGEPVVERVDTNTNVVMLPEIVATMTNTYVTDDTIYNVMRADQSFVEGEYGNRPALSAYTELTARGLNNSLQAALTATHAQLEPILTSAEVVLNGNASLITPVVQHFLDEQIVTHAALLELSTTPETLNLFFDSVAKNVSTMAEEQPLTVTQLFYAIGRLFMGAVQPSVPPTPEVVAQVNEAAREVCTLAEKEVDQSFLSDKPVEVEVAEQQVEKEVKLAAVVLGEVAQVIVAATQQAVQTTANVTQEIGGVAIEAAQITAQIAARNAKIAAQQVAEATINAAKTTGTAVQEVGGVAVEAAQITAQIAARNAKIAAQQVAETAAKTTAEQAAIVRQQVAEKTAEVQKAAAKAAAKAAQHAKTTAMAAEEVVKAAPQFQVVVQGTLYVVGKGLVKLSKRRAREFGRRAKEQAVVAAAAAQSTLKTLSEHSQESVDALRNYITKDSTSHNLYLRKLQQQHGVGLLLYDTVIQPTSAAAFNVRMYENMTSLAGNMSLVAPAQSFREQAAVRMSWGSVFDLNRGGTAMMSSDQFVNFTRDNAASFMYTPLLPPATNNDPGMNVSFIPMVPYTGLFQDGTATVDGTFVFVPFAGTKLTFPVVLQRHPVNIAAPPPLREQVGMALTQLGAQPVVPAYTAVYVMQQMQSVDTLVKILLTLLPEKEVVVQPGAVALALAEDVEASVFARVTEVPNEVDVQSTLASFQELTPAQVKAMLHGLEQYRQQMQQVRTVADRGVVATSGVFYPERTVFPHQVNEAQVAIAFQSLHAATETFVAFHPEAPLPVDVRSLQADVAAAQAVLRASNIGPASTLDLLAGSVHVALAQTLTSMETKLEAYAALLVPEPIEAAAAPVDVTVQQQQYARLQVAVEEAKFHLAVRQALNLQVSTGVETVNALQATRTDMTLQQGVETANQELAAWVSNNTTLVSRAMSELADKQTELRSALEDVVTTEDSRSYYEPSDSTISEQIHSILESTHVPIQRTVVSQFAAPVLAAGSTAAALLTPLAVPGAAAGYVQATEFIKGLTFMQNLLGLNPEAPGWQEVAQFVQAAERLHRVDPDQALEFVLNSNAEARFDEAGRVILRMAGRVVEGEGEPVMLPLWQTLLRKVLNVAPEQRVRLLNKFPAGLRRTADSIGFDRLRQTYIQSWMKPVAAVIAPAAKTVAVLAALQTVEDITRIRVGLTSMVEVAQDMMQEPGRVAKDDVAKLAKTRESLKQAMFNAQTHTLVDEKTKQPWHPAKQMHFTAALAVAIEDIEHQMVSALKLQQTGPLAAAPLEAFSADVQKLVDNVSVMMSAAVKTKVRGTAGGVFVREQMRQEVEGVLSYLQRQTAFLATVPDKNKGLGIEEVLKFAQTPLPAAVFEPKWEDVSKFVAGERANYVVARDKAQEALAAIEARVIAQYESQTGRPIAAAAPSGVNKLFQHPIDKDTYIMLQNLHKLQSQMEQFKF